MPHLTLEYSANVELPGDLDGLFADLHAILANNGGVRLGNCKSRGSVAEDYRVGSGRESEAFVHLDIRLLEGRMPEVKQSIGRESLMRLVEWFSAPAAALELQITVEVRDIGQAFYFKIPEGTLTPQ